MLNTGRPTPTRKKPQPTRESKKRAAIFSLCKELGYDDDTRRTIAASCRTDKKSTMQGMGYLEMCKMEAVLWGEFKKLKAANKVTRERRQRRKKRLSGEVGEYTDPVARTKLRSLAESLWGDGSDLKLNAFLGNQWKFFEAKHPEIPKPKDCLCVGDKLYVPWNSESLPRAFHQKCTEGVKAMLSRK